MPCCMKYGQQRLIAGRKNYIFFLCPLDGEQFIYIHCSKLFFIEKPNSNQQSENG